MLVLREGGDRLIAEPLLVCQVLKTGELRASGLRTQDQPYNGEAGPKHGSRFGR